MNWKKTVERIERDAIVALVSEGLPHTRDEISQWLKHSQPETDLARFAVQVIFGVYYLRDFVERGRLDSALDKLLEVIAAHNEMDVLWNVPAYGGARQHVTQQYFKDTHDGARAREGRKTAGRKKKATPEQVKKALDAEHQKKPRARITVLREEAALHLGISLSTLKTISMYDPKKAS